MSDANRPGVVISDGRCGVRLVPYGDADEIGQPTIIEAWVGPFSGTVQERTVASYACFRDQLARLYDALSGEARLISYEGFSLTLPGDGLGAVAVDVEIIGEHVPMICIGRYLI